MMAEEQQDIVVIGAGVAGLTMALCSLRLGLKVTLVDPSRNMGGSSLHYNCVPTKAFSEIAKVAYNVNNSNLWGLDCYPLAVDIRRINAQITDIQQKISYQNELILFNREGGKFILGEAKFIDAKHITVEGQKIAAKYFVIATGSRPVHPKILGLDKVGYITSRNISHIKKLPESLAIIGSSRAAIEYAQIFRRFGVKVTVVDFNYQILSRSSFDNVEKLQEALESEDIKFFLQTKVLEVYVKGKLKVLECIDQNADRFTINASEIFIGLDEKANIRTLDLDKVGIKYSYFGIFVDHRLKTNVKNIFAIGDVCHTKWHYSHIAEYQANIVVCNLAYKLPKQIDYYKIPYVIYTDPELAQIGYTELDVKAGIINKVDIVNLALEHLDVAICKQSSKGFIKLLIKSDKIVGATVLASNAGEIISDIALAIDLQATVYDLAGILYPYLTMSQLIRKAANKYLMDKKHSSKSSGLSKKIVRVLNTV